MRIAQVLAGRDIALVSCSAGTGVAEAARLLADNRIGALPVFDNGTIAGIFSERDLLYCIAKEGAAVLDRTVGDVMTTPAITIRPDSSVNEALALMTRRRIRHLPVVEAGEVRGFLSIGDLVKNRMDEIAGEAEAMREYIATA